MAETEVNRTILLLGHLDK